MSRVDLQITRRSFLTSAGATAGLAPASLAAATTGNGEGDDTDTPWYRRGPIATTFNYCDMCPWRCGVLSGYRASLSIPILHVLGNDNAKGFSGSWLAWTEAGLPTEMP